MKPNPHRGSDFEEILKSEGIYEEVMASPNVKKAIKDLGDSIQPVNAKHSRPGGMRSLRGTQVFNQPQYHQYSDRVRGCLEKFRDQSKKKRGQNAQNHETQVAPRISATADTLRIIGTLTSQSIKPGRTSQARTYNNFGQTETHRVTVIELKPEDRQANPGTQVLFRIYED